WNSCAPPIGHHWWHGSNGIADADLGPSCAPAQHARRQYLVSTRRGENLRPQTGHERATRGFLLVRVRRLMSSAAQDPIGERARLDLRPRPESRNATPVVEGV